MRLGRGLLFAILMALLCLLSPLNAENWPGWRGPRCDGISVESSVPLHWSSSKNVAWKVPTPGVGHSSPIVWNDAIFITYANLDDQTRHLIRVDRATGNVAWDTTVARGAIEVMHENNSPASATPVTDGQQIYVTFAVDGELLVAAYDFHGSKRWETRPGTFESQHGFNTSLVIDNDRIYLSGLQDGEDAFVAMLDTATGSMRWKVPRPERTRSFSTPLLVQTKTSQQLLLSGASQTISYDPLTGATLWAIAGPGSKTVSSIVVDQDAGLAYISGGRDNRFFAVDVSQPDPMPRIRWEIGKGTPYVNSPLVYRGLLHVLSDEGIYRSYDSTSGNLFSERRAVGAVSASMVAAENHVYITEFCGKTTVIENSSTYRVLAVNDLEESIVASPAISNGEMFIRSQHHLFRIIKKELSE